MKHHEQHQHLQALKSYYDWRLESGETSSAQLGWEDPVAHYERFRVLTDTVDLNYRSLLDVGSGLGDLWSHIKGRGLLCEYQGVDILPEMVHRAASRFPEVPFRCCDVIGDPGCLGRGFDIVYSAGIFNLACTVSEDFLDRAFRAFQGLAQRQVLISLLHAASPGREAQYCYFDPDETRERLASPGWTLRTIEGYLKNDFTLVAERDAPPAAPKGAGGAAGGL